ncbi:ADP-ribosyl-[dinitrogen reductase] glycohydrolase [bacterium HR26]|nr:ADP-ribosyl-[dinitrogen reductase] glycohydrolase [bacterium HR26]
MERYRDEQELQGRFLGCLLGLAIGDALGMPVEGWSPERIREQYGWIDRYLPRLGPDGQVETPAGEFTDDTELALCLVESLIGAHGFVDPEAAGYRFLRVLRSDSGRFLDPTTRRALERAAETDDFQQGIGGEQRPNCSAAARIAPIGLMHSLGRFNPEIFTRDVLRACLITHSDPEAINGALAIAYAVRLLVAAEVPPEMLIEDVLHFIDEDAVARRLRLAASLAAHGGKRERDLANLREIGTSSYVAEAVAAAFYCFAAHPDDFAAAVLTAVNAGGDTDSIAAMTGALAGAYLGAQAIPAELVDRLEGRMYLLVATPGLFQTAQRRAGLYLRLRRR